MSTAAEIKAASSCWKCLDELPAPVRKLVFKNFRFWVANPDYPSPHFKWVNPLHE